MVEHPQLFKHLTKLHRIRNTIRIHSEELDRLVANPNKVEALMYRRIMDTNLEKLIANTYEFNINSYNKLQMTKRSPVYKGNLLKLKGKHIKDTDKFADPNQAEIHRYLSEQNIQLRINKLELEKTLKNAQASFDRLEEIRLKL